jgi:thioredoxin domain-containing protein 5
MNLYRNGQFVEMYKGSRDYDLLTQYVSKHAEPSSSNSEETATPPVATAPLHVQTSRTVANPDGKVLVLDESNFQKVIGAGPAFVKFYAPW